MPTPDSSAEGATPATFESALAELEQIVATMERGDLPLAQSLVAYKRGAELLQFCQGALKEAELQVKILEKGVLKAFDQGGAQGGDGDER